MKAAQTEVLPMHYHRCSCGGFWKHDDRSLRSFESHTCPCCDGQQAVKDFTTYSLLSADQQEEIDNLPQNMAVKLAAGHDGMMIEAERYPLQENPHPLTDDELAEEEFVRFMQFMMMMSMGGRQQF